MISRTEINNKMNSNSEGHITLTEVLTDLLTDVESVEFNTEEAADAYYVKDYVLDTESVATSEMMAFAKKLDGKIRILSRAREAFQRRESESMHSTIWALSERSMVLSQMVTREDDFMEKYYSDSPPSMDCSIVSRDMI